MLRIFECCAGEREELRIPRCRGMDSLLSPKACFVHHFMTRNVQLKAHVCFPPESGSVFATRSPETPHHAPHPPPHPPHPITPITSLIPSPSATPTTPTHHPPNLHHSHHLLSPLSPPLTPITRITPHHPHHSHHPRHTPTASPPDRQTPHTPRRCRALPRVRAASSWSAARAAAAPASASSRRSPGCPRPRRRGCPPRGCRRRRLSGCRLVLWVHTRSAAIGIPTPLLPVCVPRGARSGTRAAAPRALCDRHGSVTRAARDQGQALRPSNATSSAARSVPAADVRQGRPDASLKAW